MFILFIIVDLKTKKDLKDYQVGFLALNKNGETGAFSIQKGFNYAKYNSDGNKLFDADSFVK